MAREQVSIKTADRACPTYVVTPKGAGPWPTVIFYMDALGMRTALPSMAGRLSDKGAGAT